MPLFALPLGCTIFSDVVLHSPFYSLFLSMSCECFCLSVVFSSIWVADFIKWTSILFLLQLFHCTTFGRRDETEQQTTDGVLLNRRIAACKQPAEYLTRCSYRTFYSYEYIGDNHLRAIIHSSMYTARWNRRFYVPGQGLLHLINRHNIVLNFRNNHHLGLYCFWLTRNSFHVFLQSFNLAQN